jgi:hypothetical protein
MKMCLLILLSLAPLLLTCTPENVLPETTQTGQNTLGCLIDGKPHIPDGGGAFSGLKPVYGGLSGIRSTPYRVGVYVYTYAKDKQRIELFINDYKLGPHLLNKDTQTMPANIAPQDYGLYQSAEGDTYVTSSRFTGQITILKADTATGIVAGTFEFTAATPTGRTVTISQGRFDVNARTQ